MYFSPWIRFRYMDRVRVACACARLMNRELCSIARCRSRSPRRAAPPGASSRCAAPVVNKVGSGSGCLWAAKGTFASQPVARPPRRLRAPTAAVPPPRRGRRHLLCAPRVGHGWVAWACQPNRRRVTTRNRKLPRRR
jgi:hypothetical protein